jgi:hypothetical protein
MTEARTTMEKYTPAEVAFAKQLASRRIALELEVVLNPTRRGVPATTMELPITKIDDIDVMAEIRIVENPNLEGNCMCLYVDNYAIGNIFCKWYHLTKETAYEDTKALLKVIKSLKFDKTTSRFECDCDCDCCKSNKNDLKPEMWNELLGESENIKLRWDTCCVCHEITNSALRDCKHTICLICADKLEVNEEIGAITCPICRDTCSVHITEEGEHTLIRR